MGIVCVLFLLSNDFLHLIMISLQPKFLHMLTGPCCVKPGCGIAIAVSGGPDSMALLHLLARVRLQLELECTAVWVDHGLRPGETGQEGETVAAAADRLGIFFVGCQVDVAAHAAAQHLSIEHAARELRYAVLRKAASDRGAGCIAVAHTADDQAEEILLRLLRGSGRKGVSGMRMRSGDLIRPLLQTDKDELLCWLREQGIDYCIDASNNDLKFLRNRVRHQLLPFLQEHFDPGIGKSLRKTADSLAEDEHLLAGMSETALDEVVRHGPSDAQGGTTMRIMRHPFCALHPALQRRVVEQLLWQVGARAGFDHILLVLKAAASGRTHSELHLSRGLRVGIFREYLELSYPEGRRPWRGSLFSTQ